MWEGKRLLRTGDGRGDLEGRRGDADEVFHLTVQHIGAEFAGGGVAHEFEVIDFLAQHDGGAAVRGLVLVFRRRRIGGVVVAGVRIALGAGGERAEEQAGEGGAKDGFHG
ncbi:MAG: hypothetical protein NTV51_26515 [Verrucomicrobia bacterium]|nr:hypothetical protein [Verrucomicrobiota bacterium]